MPSEAKLERLQIIANPTAGQGQAHVDWLRAQLHDRGPRWRLDLTTPEPDSALRLARAAIERGVDAIAVSGGDGTISGCLEALVEGDVPLVVLPAGTANIIATELGIPLDLDAALALVDAPMSGWRRVDLGYIEPLGEAERQLFAIRVNVGNLAEVVSQTDAGARQRLGNIAYLGNFLGKALRDEIHRVDFRLEIDDAPAVEFGALDCIVSNMSPFLFHGLRLDDLAGQAILPDDGRLNLSYVREDFRLDERPVGERPPPTARELRLWTRRPCAVQCDGDASPLTTPLRIGVLPEALRVLVPAPARMP